MHLFDSKPVLNCFKINIYTIIDSVYTSHLYNYEFIPDHNQLFMVN